jgi:hypothetical protein
MASVEVSKPEEQLQAEIQEDDKPVLLSDKEFYAIFLDFIDN